MKKNYLKLTTLFIVFFAIQFAKAQQDPNRPDNTYFITEQVDVWTTNAANQAEFDTPAERSTWIFREALVQYNALHGGHKDLAYIVPHQHSTEVTTEITEDGVLDNDLYNYEVAVNDGRLSSLAGATHILRVYGSDITGTAEGIDLNDRRFIVLNMETSTLRTRAHEFAHTFNGALHGSHDNALSSVPIEFFYLDGSSGGGANRPTLGIPTAALQAELYTSSTTNSIGNPTFGGDGYVYYDYYNTSGVLIGYGRVAIADLDNGGSNNVSDGIATAMNSGDPGYAPTTLSVLASDETIKPAVIVDDGKYKLTNKAANSALGFTFDAFGNKFPAKIYYYPYDATNDVNDANLDLPPGYNSERGITAEQFEAGIDKSFYDTNYPGIDIVWKMYSFDPDSLSVSSDVIAGNNAPETANSTVSTNEDTVYTFDTNDFNYSDVDGDPLAKLKPTTLPPHGILKLSGTPVTAGQEILAADIPNLTFHPDLNWYGTTTFEFSASDGTDWSTPDTMSITINSVNDIPASNNTSTTSNEDEILTYSTTNYPFSDVESANFDHINVVNLPAHATLKLSGTPVSAGASITYANIPNFTFEPDADWNGTTTWSFSVSDGIDDSPVYTMTAHVNEVNDAPSIPTGVNVVNVNESDVELSFNAATDIDGTIDHYNIYVDGNLHSTATTLNPTITVTDNGTHTVQISAVDNQGLEGGLSATVNFDITLGVSENQIEGLKIYPNPTTAQISIKANEPIQNVLITDILGKQIINICPSQTQINLNLSKLSKGMYLMTIKTDNAVSIKKIIKE